tara:strand:- start:65 stop:397 length:333 start_codon:yes stop_codon:yes gene_type:complete
MGRESKKWIDFNLYGHQVVAHLSPEDCTESRTNFVDGNKIPVRHYGVILPWDKWEEMCEMIRKKDTQFLIEPKIRFKGKTGEQGTFFINDPSANTLEFKSFKNDSDIFRK